MAKTTPEQNKAIVLEAFDTLFNKRDYETAARSGRPPTFSTALISRRVVTGFSALSKPCQENCVTRAR